MLQPSNSGKAPTGAPTLTRSFHVSWSWSAWTGVERLGGGPARGAGRRAAGRGAGGSLLGRGGGGEQKRRHGAGQRERDSTTEGATPVGHADLLWGDPGPRASPGAGRCTANIGPAAGGDNEGGTNARIRGDQWRARRGERRRALPLNLRANLSGSITPNLMATVTTGYVRNRATLPWKDNDAQGALAAGMLGSAQFNELTGGYFSRRPENFSFHRPGAGHSSLDHRPRHELAAASPGCGPALRPGSTRATTRTSSSRPRASPRTAPC
jgi:hypothetical protein